MSQSQQVVEELYDMYTKTASNIMEYFDGNEMKEKLKVLRNLVQDHCTQSSKLKAAEDGKELLLELYNEQIEMDTEEAVKKYKETVATFKIDAAVDEKLIQFDRQVEALLQSHGDQAEYNGDEEMQLTGANVNVIDPITKKRMVDPVKNSVCGHTYDREAITEVLKVNKRTRCPVVGCKTTDFVSLEKLRPDIVVKSYLERNPA